MHGYYFIFMKQKFDLNIIENYSVHVLVYKKECLDKKFEYIYRQVYL